MERLFGVIAGFDHAMILHKDTRYFGYIRADLIDLTLKHGYLNHLEIAIGGYNDDNRALYEFPEVRRWVKLAHQAYSDSLLWMTPGSLWVWVLCLNPGLISQLPDGRNQIAMNTKIIIPQFVKSMVAGEEILKNGGMTEEQVQGVKAQAEQNFLHMLERKKPGEDYLLLNPEGGQTVWYKREQ